MFQIAEEVERGTYEMRERFGLSPKEGNEEGLLDDNPEDCIFWFSNGAYFDPESPQCIFITGDSYDLWDRTEIWGSLKPFKPIWDLSPQFVNTLGQSVPMFGGGSTLGPANVYTFRTSDFMLSSTQNYRSKFSLDGIFRVQSKENIISLRGLGNWSTNGLASNTG